MPCSLGNGQWIKLLQSFNRKCTKIGPLSWPQTPPSRVWRLEWLQQPRTRILHLWGSLFKASGLLRSSFLRTSWNTLHQPLLASTGYDMYSSLGWMAAMALMMTKMVAEDLAMGMKTRIWAMWVLEQVIQDISHIVHFGAPQLQIILQPLLWNRYSNGRENPCSASELLC